MDVRTLRESALLLLILKTIGEGPVALDSLPIPPGLVRPKGGHVSGPVTIWIVADAMEFDVSVRQVVEEEVSERLYEYDERVAKRRPKPSRGGRAEFQDGHLLGGWSEGEAVLWRVKCRAQSN